jgi:hypothetical protein
MVLALYTGTDLWGTVVKMDATSTVVLEDNTRIPTPTIILHFYFLIMLITIATTMTSLHFIPPLPVAKNIPPISSI